MKTTFLIVLACIILFACNKSNCKYCSQGNVAAVDSAYIAIPDIFTPNGDGVNDLLYVIQRNITSVQLTIKHNNRVEFQSTSLSTGWDGMYKSKQAKEKSYSYTVQATTTSGRTISLGGEICLIRDNCSKTPLSACAFGSQFNFISASFDPNLPSLESIKECK